MTPYSHLALMAALLLLSGCGESSDVPTQSLSADRGPTATALPTTAPPVQSSEFTPVNANTETVSYISDIDQASIAVPGGQQSRNSDEYWHEVSGRQLNQGVDLTLSQAGGLVRLAPRADLRSGTLIHGDAIDPGTVQLRQAVQGANQAPRRDSEPLIRSATDAMILASAGINDDSSALLLSNSLKPGAYRLTVGQPLLADSRYLVHVKEKGSPHQLVLTAPSSLSLADTGLELKIDWPGQLVADNGLTAFVVLENGQRREVTLHPQQDHYTARFDVIDDPIVATGFSEMMVDSVSLIDGIKVKRRVKTAFKRVAQTAALTGLAHEQWHQGELQALITDVTVAKAGRYQLRAVLGGHNVSGELRAAMRSDIALWLEPGNHQVTIPVDPARFHARAVGAPYSLLALTLTDQSQMAVLDALSEAVTLNPPR
ncbi:protein of unknown function [Ferrimonas sediminum]|uniref:DUF4785 domain-containing protein n=1 Tax=Ferrimonas sediminum TaxID=718193 RepID=A0A1G8S9V2_9GAMM|nr:DUF4785 domain-containing protein [Ferrimonas sediminum]SDJ25947.1 protein of unknown function [Ferrimonas sediminum]